MNEGRDGCVVTRVTATARARCDDIDRWRQIFVERGGRCERTCASGSIDRARVLLLGAR